VAAALVQQRVEQQVAMVPIQHLTLLPLQQLVVVEAALQIIRHQALALTVVLEVEEVRVMRGAQELTQGQEHLAKEITAVSFIPMALVTV
jgi:hypothetical protein